MKKRIFMHIAAGLLAACLCTPTVLPVERATGELIQVGLAYGGDALISANLENNSGHGAGYRFGYYDKNLHFVEVARTTAAETQITMVKAQNVWVSGNTYSTSNNGGALIGCYHLETPETYDSYEAAAGAASQYPDGFVAWENGVYRVRVGSYASREDAQADQALVPQGSITGSSSYAVTVIRSKTNRILFQFDGGAEQALAVMPDVTNASSVRTWFKGYRYSGGFRYERLGGGNMTVVNVVDLETYIKGVIPYEMNNSWPLEALKAQAICARSYAYNNIQSSSHQKNHFDICDTTHCQVYRGAGGTSSSYQSNERTDQAVDQTAGQYAWYDGKIIQAFYSASHGGASEDIYHVWGSSREQYPYLCGVVDPYEQDMAAKNSYSSWQVSYTSRELTKRLQDKGYGTGTSVSALELTYSKMGNVIQLKVFYDNGQSNTFKPDRIRSLLGVSSIRFTVNGNGNGTTGGSGTGGTTEAEVPQQSTIISGSGTISQASQDELYVISGSGSVDPLGLPAVPETDGGEERPSGSTVRVSGGSYLFAGSGNGHQLGMSQYGAYAMSNRGFPYDQIIEFYFPGTHVQ